MVMALLIDPVEKTAQQLESDGSLDSMYKLIGCEVVQRIYPIPEAPHIAMYIDEEGRLKSGQKCFFIGAYLIAGKALVVHEEQQAGKEDPVLHDIELLEALILTDMIVGCPDDYDYTPGPPTVIVWDLSKAH